MAEAPPRRRRDAPRPERIAPVAAPAAAWGRHHWALVLTLLAALLLVLHGDALTWPFVSDDLVFLDASREFRQLFSSFDVYSNYFRPIGRELYFFVGYLLARNDPFPYHAFNFLVLLGIVVGVVGLGHRLAGPRVGVLAGTAYALLYSHHLTLAWISCSQDLLAAGFALAAVHALLSRRAFLAALLHVAALLSKESVAALPLVYAAWRALEPGGATRWRERLGRGVRASAPLWAATAAWAVIVLAARIQRQAWAKGPGSALADVSLSFGSLWEGMRSALLTYVALEQPWGAIGRALTAPGMPWLVLAGAAAILFALSWAIRRPRAALSRTDGTLRLAVLWAVVGATPIALAGHHYSAYYITFSAIGFALGVGRLLSAAPPAVAFTLLTAGTALGLAADRVDLFNFAKMEPAAGVSYITTTRLAHERRFLDSLHVALDRTAPARGTIVYLSHAPRHTTFVTMSGRAPRVWYADPDFELRMIGEYRGAPSRPHAFMRFVPATRGFIRVSNELMRAYLAAEDAMNAREPAQALAHLDRGLALLPPTGLEAVHVDLLNNRGFALGALGDTAGARGDWLRALELDPASESAALNLARVDAGAGRLPSARRTLERLLENAPNATEALVLLARIQNAQGDAAAVQATFARLAAIDPERAAVLRRTIASTSGP
jgi:tetratricopeptide (TPR) repeat protein